MADGDIFQLAYTQATDPFRIGLLVLLAITTRNTARQTGTVLPLLAGIVFVAALIPLTTGSASGVGFGTAFGVGLAVNAVIAAIAFALVIAWTRAAARR